MSKPRRALSQRSRALLRNFLLAAFAVLFMVLIAADRIVMVVEAGHAGVLFNLFTGTQVGKTYEEGLHLIFPWSRMIVYDVRLQEIPVEIDVLSKNGLVIKVNLSIRIAPDRRHLSRLHLEVGPEYAKNFVVPIVGSAVREVIGKFGVDSLYLADKSHIQSQIMGHCTLEVSKIHIKLDDVKVKSVKLPEKLNAAIEAKLKQQQRYQEYEHLIEQAKNEKERKRNEALGVKVYNETLAVGLTEDILRWRGIQATHAISKSTNRKVLVIGGEGNVSTPIFLGASQVKP